ncbi:MAG: DUF1572 family protein [Thermaceae bacterium]|nr:DUF1572 family protein [Thermaceae bacterium]
MSELSVGELFLQASINELERYKTLCEGALAQVSEKDWFYVPAPESNSLAILVKHVAGNLRSRWSDFLSTDGEKPHRNRDTEFELTQADTVESLRQHWDESWEITLGTLRDLTAADLTRTITIRSQPVSVVDAAQRSLAHISYHAGQIVALAKQIRGSEFSNLSVPKGKSEEFLASMQQGYAKPK